MSESNNIWSRSEIEERLRFMHRELEKLIANGGNPKIFDRILMVGILIQFLFCLSFLAFLIFTGAAKNNSMALVALVVFSLGTFILVWHGKRIRKRFHELQLEKRKRLQQSLQTEIKCLEQFLNKLPDSKERESS